MGTKNSTSSRDTHEASIWRRAPTKAGEKDRVSTSTSLLVPLPSSAGCLVRSTNSKEARSQNKRASRSHTRRSSLPDNTFTRTHALRAKSKTKGTLLKSAATLASVHATRTKPSGFTASPALAASMLGVAGGMSRFGCVAAGRLGPLARWAGLFVDAAPEAAALGRRGLQLGPWRLRRRPSFEKRPARRSARLRERTSSPSCR